MALPPRAPLLLPLAFMLHALAAAARRVRPDADARELAPGDPEDLILSYNATKCGAEDSRMSISRQGALAYEGRPGVYEFTRSELNREFLIRIDEGGAGGAGEGGQCQDLVVVKRERIPGLCGTDLFTQPSLQCSELPFQGEHAEIEQLQGMLDVSERGFSVELELVARIPGPDTDVPDSALNLLFGDGYKVAKKCFELAVESGRKGGTCKDHSDCTISEYCWDSRCSDRVECNEYLIDGGCPVAAARWNWEDDPTVLPLTQAQAAALGVGKDQQEGIPFEMTSPGPPHVLSGGSGMRSVIEVMTVLRHMGVQAGPSSGMHVHVNVMNPDVPGKLLDFRGVARIWAAYARYQLVIDEMLSPGRPGNRWGHRLFLGNCPKKKDKVRCSTAPCGCIRLIWERMHDYVQNPVNMSRLELCTHIHRMKGWKTPCTERYPHQRYFQVNLVPMSKFGTIEFRAHSATTDSERVVRWAQFLVAFVEHFGSGAGGAKMDEFFRGTADDDYIRLQKAQAQATAKELFQEIGATIDKGSEGYFASRAWEKEGDAACDPPTKSKSYVQARCAPQDDDFVTATIAEELEHGVQRLHVALPESASTDSVTILLPDGATWTVSFTSLWGRRFLVKFPTGKTKPMLTRKSFAFKYDPHQQAEARKEDNKEYRCCCEDADGEQAVCRWFPTRFLKIRGKCPILWTPTPNDASRCVDNWCSWKFGGTCVQTSHSRRFPSAKCGLSGAEDDSSAYFTGDFCKA